MKRRLSCLLLVLLLRAPLSAQATPFDLASLRPPPGLLDLSDLVVVTDADGVLTATASTRLGNAEALVLLSTTLPYGGGERQVVLGIKPLEWKLTEAIPALSNPVLDGLTFDKVALVLADREVEQHSSQLDDAAYAFYREVYQADDFRMVLKPGINLIAAIPAESLEPGHPLAGVMDALGIEKGTILLQGTLGKSLALLGGGGGGADIIKDLYLRAELPPMRPPGSPEWFRSGQLALELTGDPSVRLVGEVTVYLDETELMFFLAAALARSGMSLAGGLATEAGWQQPFGIPWLVLNRVVLMLGITTAGSVQPGFAASMVIGEKDIDVAIALAISPTGVPTSMSIKGESETGFGLSDLIMLQQGMAAARDAAASASGAAPPPSAGVPLDALPPADLRRVALQFAPKDLPELGIERGMKLKGELWLPLSADGQLTNFASVDVGVSEEGLWARGHLDAFTLGPLTWEDAALDLTATRETQHLMLKGDVTLFGARQAVDLLLTREQLSFQTQTELFDLFSADVRAQAAFNLQRPDFQVDAVAGAEFGELLGPLVAEGVAAFAASSADVLEVAGSAARAAEQALMLPEATVAELRRVLEVQREVAANAVATARRTADQRRAEMNSAWAARNSALRRYQATPVRPPWRKAQTLAEYQRAHTTYLTRAARYSASVAALAASQRVYAAIPPVDQNIQLQRAEEAVARLRAQLQTMQQNLTYLENRFAAIETAIERGEEVLVIERAEFHGGLQSAMSGQPVRWDILGSFVGERFEVHRTLDFSNVGQGAADLLQGLLER